MSTKIDDQALTFKLTLKYEEILDHLEKAINAEERVRLKVPKKIQIFLYIDRLYFLCLIPNI